MKIHIVHLDQPIAERRLGWYWLVFRRHSQHVKTLHGPYARVDDVVTAALTAAPNAHLTFWNNSTPQIRAWRAPAELTNELVEHCVAESVRRGVTERIIRRRMAVCVDEFRMRPGWYWHTEWEGNEYRDEDGPFESEQVAWKDFYIFCELDPFKKSSYWSGED
jgi:hypothetical protein